jgi:hypothetical protein
MTGHTIYPKTEIEIAAVVKKLEGVSAMANAFFESFDHRKPREVSRLEALVDSVSTPSQEDDGEYEPRKGEDEADYWTIERMFEDL